MLVSGCGLKKKKKNLLLKQNYCPPPPPPPPRNALKKKTKEKKQKTIKLICIIYIYVTSESVWFFFFNVHPPPPPPPPSLCSLSQHIQSMSTEKATSSNPHSLLNLEFSSLSRCASPMSIFAERSKLTVRGCGNKRFFF